MPRRPATAVLTTASLLLAALGSASIAAATPPLPPKQTGSLALSLYQLARPALRSLPPGPRARALGVAASGPGSLIRGDDGVLVEVRSPGALPSLPALRAAGATIVSANPSYRTVTARIPASDLEDVAALPRVASVGPVREPVLRASCAGGSVISEGVAQLNVERGGEGARQAFGLEGEGMTVGVLSDSLHQAKESVGGTPIKTREPEDVESNDLPGSFGTCPGQKTPVADLMDYLQEPDGEDPFDEGRAMLQVVHDVAPKAKLAFYSAFNGETKFAKGIEALAKPAFKGGPGADVIADDVGYFEEPFFQDGPVAAAIDKVTEEGVAYVTAAGNDNLADSSGDEIASWEAPEYRDSGSCPGAVRALTRFNPHHCLDFDPGAPVDRTFGIKVEPEETLSIDLQWAEPWLGVQTDLDAFLLDSEGEILTASTEENVTVSQKPVEIVQWTNDSKAEKTVQLVVNRFLGSANPRLKFILLENGAGVSATEYPVSGGGDVVGPAVYGHAGSAAAISVAAVPYNHSSRAEEYSSRGPVTHYFGPVEPGAKGPAAALPSPQVISKPDVAASDCVRTTFFASEPKTEPGVWRFCGTSAASPHAAAVAALMLQHEPTASAAEVQAALDGTGSAVGSFGPCAVGGGLIEALGAVEAVAGGPSSAPAACEYPDASGPVVRAPGDWGSEEPPPHPEEEVPVPNVTQPPPPPSPQRPNTSIAKHPAKTVGTRSRTARGVFRFKSDLAGSTFLCRIDSAPAFKACGAKLTRSFGLGKHVVRVKARSSAGLTDASAAVFGFRVRRVG